MSEDHTCFRSSSFTPIRHGSWFQHRISWRFCSSHTTSFAHTKTIESTWQHVKEFLNPYNRMVDYIYHLANYSSPSSSTSLKPWISVGCNHGLERTLPRSVADTPWGLHVTTDDVALSFVMLCAPHAAKIPNYSTTSERIADAPRFIICGLRSDRVHVE